MTAIPLRQATRPGHAILFSTSLPLFLGTLISDWAYSKTFVIQWSNFASWLNAGALVIVGAALAWTLVAVIVKSSTRDRRGWLYLLLVAAVFVVGFINALVHAKDGWATMPAGLILSIIVFVLALVTAWIGLNAGKRDVAR